MPGPNTNVGTKRGTTMFVYEHYGTSTTEFTVMKFRLDAAHLHFAN